MRIYWTAASISVSTGINLFDFTAQRLLLHGGCFPPSTALSGKMFEHYGTLKLISVEGIVPGLTKDFAAVTF